MANTEVTTCKGMKANGEPCGSTVVLENGFCKAHQEQAVVKMIMAETEVAEHGEPDPSGNRSDMADGDTHSSLSYSQTPSSETKAESSSQTDTEVEIIVGGLDDEIEIVVEDTPVTSQEALQSTQTEVSTDNTPKASMGLKTLKKAEVKHTNRRKVERVEHLGFVVRKIGQDYKEPPTKKRYVVAHSESFRQTNGRIVLITQVESGTKKLINYSVEWEKPDGERQVVTQLVNRAKVFKRARGWAKALDLAFDPTKDIEVVEHGE